MKIHYFQRYHSKENVITGNTLLLISRLYHYSPSKFHSFLKSLVGAEFQDFDTDVRFDTQIKNIDSVPDGAIKQNSFNIVVETKLGKGFDLPQIKKHLSTFEQETYQVMLTLSPFGMVTEQVKQVSDSVKDENQANNKRIKHIHTTFENLIALMSDVIEDKDYEFLDILEDYKECCSHEGLIKNKDRWMRAVPVGKSFDDNLKYSLYHDPVTRGFSDHGFIGLYKEKAICAVGKIVNIIKAEKVNGKLVVSDSTSPVTAEQKQNILNSIDAASRFDWNVDVGHQFFCVDKFYETKYVKSTKGPLQGTKFFDLDTLFSKNTARTAENISNELNGKSW